jgi:hypothetical protein
MKKETKLQVGDIVRFSTNPSVFIRGMTDNIGKTAVVTEVRDEYFWFWKEDVDPLGNDMFRGPTVVVQIGDKQKLVLNQILEKIEETTDIKNIIQALMDSQKATDTGKVASIHEITSYMKDR